uniref:E3 ubiquitin protein ligase n=1 Tax=Poecilia latipinna TaxID=48699 RepID=A0A3B3VVK4_9TELE
SKTKTNLNGFLKSELCPGSAGGSVRLRRKLEKQKKVEVYSDADEILQEEINQYKVRRNDRLVDRLCFHVFCYECLKMRYDTRQRKCPKCNCAFGRKKGETEPKGRRDQRGEQEDCRFTQTFLIFGKDSFYQIVFHLVTKHGDLSHKTFLNEIFLSKLAQKSSYHFLFVVSFVFSACLTSGC